MIFTIVLTMYVLGHRNQKSNFKYQVAKLE